MERMFKYSFALLGSCGIVFLSTAAHSSQDISFVQVPVFEDITCGQESEEYTYVIKNNRSSAIGLGDIRIDILPGDSFPNNTDLVHPEFDYGNPHACVPYMDLPGGATCAIDVIVDPSDLNCASDDELVIIQGEVHRELYIGVDTLQLCLLSDIFFDVTILGEAGEFQLLAPSIFNTTNPDEDPDLLSHDAIVDITVTQNVANTSEMGFLTPYIQFTLPREGYAYGPNDEITHDAVDSLEAAYTALFNLQYTGCGQLPNNFGDGFPAACPDPDDPDDVCDFITQSGPGVYCIDQSAPYPLVIDGTFTLNGNEDDIFIFIINFDDSDDTNNIVFQMEENADMVMGGQARPNNVFWVVNGSTEILNGAYLIGNLLGTGSFEVEEDASAAAIMGRILLLGDDDDDGQSLEPESTVIELFGTTVSKPY